MLSPALLRPPLPSIARTPTTFPPTLQQPKLVQSLLPPFLGRPPNLLPSPTKEARRPLRPLLRLSNPRLIERRFSAGFASRLEHRKVLTCTPISNNSNHATYSGIRHQTFLCLSFSLSVSPSHSDHSVSLISASASSRIRPPFPRVHRIQPSHHTGQRQLPASLDHSLLPTASCTLPPLLVPHLKVCIAANTTCVYMRTS